MAAAAYRAGELLKDERSGRTHRYDKRHGVKTAYILAPSSAPSKFLTRTSLWNAAEASETRKNSRVAREVILALPHELSDTERHDLTRDMALYLIERYRVAVDVALHSPVKGDGHDPRNHHAHLLFTTRELSHKGLGAKTRVLDDKVTGPQEIEIIREVWETLANDALSRAGFTDVKIDRRTLEGQGIDRIPQTHIGPEGIAAEEREYREQDSEEDDDSGEDGNGGKTETEGKQGGKSDSGDLPPKLKEDTRKDKDLAQLEKGKEANGTDFKLEAKDTDRQEDSPYKNIDQGRRRLDFVEEIKKLNERRAAFSNIPLKDQIRDIEVLIEKLDHRVERLEALKEKTSLSSRILSSFGRLIELSRELIFHREEHGKFIKLSQAERIEREERQKERYGRTYRTGLHEQIRNMQIQLDRLEQLKSSYVSYKSFVEKIERQAAFATPAQNYSKADTHKVIEASQPKETTKPESLRAAFKETPVTVTAPPEERKLKLSLKAEMLRENIPSEYKPRLGSAGVAVSMPSIKATLNQTAAIPKTPIKLTASFGEQIIPTKQDSTENIASYKQPLKVELKSINQAIEERQGANTSKPETKPSMTTEPKLNPSNRENWFTPASDKTKPLQLMIEKKIEEQRQQAQVASPPAVVKPDLNTLKGQFTQVVRAAPIPEPVKYEDILSKTRAEAEIKREAIPPEFRAAPYSAEPVTLPLAETSNEFTIAAVHAEEAEHTEPSNTPEPAEEPTKEEITTPPVRVRMSDLFNERSADHTPLEDAPQSPENPPEMDLK